MLNTMSRLSTPVFGHADVLVCPDVPAMARAAADHAAAIMRAAVHERGVVHVMFATGNSQRAFIEALVNATEDVPWAETLVFHMDEYVGTGPDHPAGFQKWIRERIVEPASPGAAYYVDGQGDVEHACSRYANLLARHPLDLCCLGIGENGHLAFNDPGVADFNDPLDVKVVALDTACRQQQVNEGHFPDIRRGPLSCHHRDHPRSAARLAGDGRRPGGTQGRTGARGADRSPVD